MDPAIEQLKAAITDIQNKYLALLKLFNTHTHSGFDQTKKTGFKRRILLDAPTIDVNAGFGNHFVCTLAGSRTLGNPRNMRDGQRIVFELIQDATGSRTITLGSNFVVGPWTVTLSTAAGARDFIDCVFNVDTGKVYVLNFQKGY